MFFTLLRASFGLLSTVIETALVAASPAASAPKEFIYYLLFLKCMCIVCDVHCVPSVSVKFGDFFRKKWNCHLDGDDSPALKK